MTYVGLCIMFSANETTSTNEESIRIVNNYIHHIEYDGMQILGNGYIAFNVFRFNRLAINIIYYSG